MQEEEIWKDIPGYEGLYQVSNTGRVKRLNKTTKDRIRKLRVSYKGYYYVNLSKNNVIKSKDVHQLVAMAFFGYKPDGNKTQVNHKDFNKLNNNPENLEIISPRENTIHYWMSMKKNTSSKYIGCHYVKKISKWCASIQYCGWRANLGNFDSEEEAGDLYRYALKSIDDNGYSEYIESILYDKFKDRGIYYRHNGFQLNYKSKYIGRYKTKKEALFARLICILTD